MRDIVSPLHAALLQPIIQYVKIGELRHGLPKPMTSVPDALLNLAFLRPAAGLQNSGSKHVVVRRGQKAHVNLPFFAAPDTVNRGAHVEKISADQKGTTVR